MTDYLCANNHESASPKPLARCPHMVDGRPCPEPPAAGHFTRGGKWVAA